MNLFVSFLIVNGGRERWRDELSKIKQSRTLFATILSFVFKNRANSCVYSGLLMLLCGIFSMVEWTVGIDCYLQNWGVCRESMRCVTVSNWVVFGDTCCIPYGIDGAFDWYLWFYVFFMIQIFFQDDSILINLGVMMTIQLSSK